MAKALTWHATGAVAAAAGRCAAGITREPPGAAREFLAELALGLRRSLPGRRRRLKAPITVALRITGTERLSSSMGERSGRAGKRIGCAAIVTAAGVALGLSVHHDVQFTASVTTPQWIAEQTVELRQEQCIYHAIRAQVPKGAAVYVTSPDVYATQRLAELSTLWAVPQANIANARWRLSLVPARGHCSGLALEVRRT